MKYEETLHFLAQLFAHEVLGLPMDAIGVFSMILCRTYTSSTQGRATFTMEEWRKIAGCSEKVLNKACDALEQRELLQFEHSDTGVTAIFPYLDEKRKKLEAHRLAQRTYRENSKRDKVVIMWDHPLMERYLNGKLDKKDDVPVIGEVLELCLSNRDGSGRSELTQTGFLESLAKYDLGQVVCAAYRFVESDVKSRVSWPYDRYFLGMVRRDAGNYQRTLGWEEKRQEVLDQIERRKP